jgi:hypothetical protein
MKRNAADGLFAKPSTSPSGVLLSGALLTGEKKSVNVEINKRSGQSLQRRVMGMVVGDIEWSRLYRIFSS